MYEPKVNDYVIWDRGRFDTDEGWVYFVDIHKTTPYSAMVRNLNPLEMALYG